VSIDEVVGYDMISAAEAVASNRVLIKASRHCSRPFVCELK
jgi:hypothetical protein